MKNDIDDISLNITAAIPCGLIINELVSNALKHAFPDGRGGEVRVSVKEVQGPAYVITVADSGVGFPASLDFKQTDSLGLQLVNTLVAQLDGTIDMIRKNGTTFTVRFPKPVSGEVNNR